MNSDTNMNTKHLMTRCLLSLSLAASVFPAAAQTAASYPAEQQPGEAQTWGNKAGDTTNLFNDVLMFSEGSLRCAHRLTEGVRTDGFSLVIDGKGYGEKAFKQTNAVHVEGASEGVKLQPNDAERETGRGMRRVLQSAEAGVTIVWQAELRNGAHYVKTHYTITADRDVTLTRFVPVRVQGAGFTIPAMQPHAPLVHEEQCMFFCVQHPAAQARGTRGGAVIGIDCAVPLQKGQSVSFTAVSGVFPRGQFQRAYAAYLERERAAAPAGEKSTEKTEK